MSINMFDTRTMLRLVEQLMPPKTFLRDFIFGSAQTSESKYIDIDIMKGKRKLAPFVSPTAQAKLVERLGFSTNTIEAPYVKMKMVTTAGDLLKRMAGETIYGSGTTIGDRAAAQLAKDLLYLMSLITRREEWMCSQIMDAGKVICLGDMIALTVDYLLGNTHKITLSGADLWSASTSDPIGNLETWSNLIMTDSGLANIRACMGASAWAAFAKHADVKDILNYQRREELQLKNQGLPSGAVYRCTVNLNGAMVDVYTYTESYVDENNAAQFMVPVNKVWMWSGDARFGMHYAAIQDLEALAAVPRFPKSWEEKDPSARILSVQSAPLPAMHQPDACVSAKVVA